LIRKIGETEKSVITFFLFHGEELSFPQVKIEGLSDETLYEALSRCVKGGILNCRYERIGDGPLSFNSWYWIPEGYKPALKKLLLGIDEAQEPSTRI